MTPCRSKFPRFYASANSRRVVGRQHLCRLHAEPLKEAMLWTEQFRQHWEARFQALDTLLEEMKSEERPRRRRR